MMSQSNGRSVIAFAHEAVEIQYVLTIVEHQ